MTDCKERPDPPRKASDATVNVTAIQERLRVDIAEQEIPTVRVRILPTLVVPVFEYVPVTEMRPMLKEEVRIAVEETEKTSVHTAEVQRQELVGERRAGTDGDWIAQPAPPSSEDGEQSVS